MVGLWERWVTALPPINEAVRKKFIDSWLNVQLSSALGSRVAVGLASALHKRPGGQCNTSCPRRCAKGICRHWRFPFLPSTCSQISVPPTSPEFLLANATSFEGKIIHLRDSVDSTASWAGSLSAGNILTKVQEMVSVCLRCVKDKKALRACAPICLMYNFRSNTYTVEQIFKMHAQFWGWKKC